MESAKSDTMKGIRKMKKAFFASLCAAALCGCVSNPPPPKPLPKGPAQYVPEGEVINGRASEMTMYDLETATQELLAKMRKSALFTQNYTAVKAKKGALPVIVVGNIENRTTSRIQDRLDTVREIVNTSLYEMDLFEVKDDTASSQIAARILQSETSGLENGAAVAALGTHDSPDFMLIGDLSAFKDFGGYHTYKLHLAIHNLATGKVVWQGIQTKIKL